MEVKFATKPQLARQMIERALQAGVPCKWVTGDEVYGNDRRLRVWLEEQGVFHVLAVGSGQHVWGASNRCASSASWSKSRPLPGR